MGVAIIIKKLKAAITKLKNQIAIGIKNARKYILKLIDCENKLASIEAVVQPAPKPVATPVQLNLLDFLSQQLTEDFVNANDKKTGEYNSLHLNGR